MSKTVVVPVIKTVQHSTSVRPPRKVVQETRWKHSAPLLHSSVDTSLALLRHWLDQSTEPGTEATEQLVLSHLRRKLSSYRNQDIEKGLWDEGGFVTLRETVQCMVQGGLQCHFCREGVKILYEECRDPLQWSLDRIDNTLGHVVGNVYVVCLRCNLRRRRQDHDRFYFTKRVVWKKEGGEDEDNKVSS